MGEGVISLIHTYIVNLILSGDLELCLCLDRYILPCKALISPVLRKGNWGWLVVACLCKSARGDLWVWEMSWCVLLWKPGTDNGNTWRSCCSLEQEWACDKIKHFIFPSSPFLLLLSLTPQWICPQEETVTWTANFTSVTKYVPMLVSWFVFCLR